MTHKQWIVSSSPHVKPKVTDAIKKELTDKANALIENVIKPDHISPPPLKFQTTFSC